MCVYCAVLSVSSCWCVVWETWTSMTGGSTPSIRTASVLITLWSSGSGRYGEAHGLCVLSEKKLDTLIHYYYYFITFIAVVEPYELLNITDGSDWIQKNTVLFILTSWVHPGMISSNWCIKIIECHECIFFFKINFRHSNKPLRSNDFKDHEKLIQSSVSKLLYAWVCLTPCHVHCGQLPIKVCLMWGSSSVYSDERVAARIRNFLSVVWSQTCSFYTHTHR